MLYNFMVFLHSSGNYNFTSITSSVIMVALDHLFGAPLAKTKQNNYFFNTNQHTIEKKTTTFTYNSPTHPQQAKPKNEHFRH